MKVLLRQIFVPLAFTIGLLPTHAYAKVLPVDVIMQETPEWSFAASSAMILQYLGYPNVNATGNYQCGIVSAQGGICSINCSACLDGGRTTQRVAAIIQMYRDFVHRVTGYNNPRVHLNEAGILSSRQIISQIDQEGPILAGIDPAHVPYPADLGITQHSVVIVGYEGTPDNLNVVINDPYLYPATKDPYVLNSAYKMQQGQYSIPLKTFVGIFSYRNSLTFR